jgi:phosphatidylglycerol---prolipoprotein diacylglyceryl transferase
VILPIYGDLALRWYGLSYLAGFIIAWLLIRWMSKTGRSIIPLAAVGALMSYVIVGVLVGGRLGYVIFYEPRYLISFTSTIPYWDVLAINKGGMSSHGGMIGTIMACLLFARNHRVTPWHVFDVGAVACTPGLFLGRIANFINAELWGRPLPPALQDSPPWWSVKYPQEMFVWSADELRELEPIVSEVGVSRSEWVQALNAHAAQGDQVPHHIARFVDGTLLRLIDAVRAGNETVIEALRPMLIAHYPSQILQAITDGPILFLVLAMIWGQAAQAGHRGEHVSHRLRPHANQYGVRPPTGCWGFASAGAIARPGAERLHDCCGNCDGDLVHAQRRRADRRAASVEQVQLTGSPVRTGCHLS